MQVQHELSLLDASQNKLLDTSNKSLDTYCLQVQLSNSMNPIEYLSVSPSSSQAGLLACHLSQTNQIHLFDTRTLKRRDKFPLKAYDKQYSRQSFQVSGMDFSPDGQRLAISQTDCVIYIYKLTTLQVATAGLPLKSAPGSGSTNSSSSPTHSDQSGPVASLKPTITGKFSASSPISCMLWSDLGIIFGSQDGRVRLILSFNKPTASPQTDASIQLTSNPSSQTNSSNSQQSSACPKVMSLLTSTKRGSMPISLAYQSTILVVGQTDGSVSVLQLAQGGTPVDLPAQSVSEHQSQLLGVSALAIVPGNEPSGPSSTRRSSSIGGNQSLGVVSSTSFEHSCPPEHLLMIQNSTTGVATICCAGSDGRIAFHSLRAQPQPDRRTTLTCSLQQAIELNEDVMSIDYSSTNEVLALASRNRLVFIKLDQEAASWRLQASTIELRNVFTLASIKWMREGAHLAVGCTSGSLELFKCVWSKQSVNDKLDICHIARNRIRITDRGRNLLATYKTQADIKRVNLLDQGQNVLIWTTSTLLIAKLGHQRLQSEIKWRFDQKASETKFLFDPNSAFVLIYDGTTSELNLLKLGQNTQSFTVKFPRGQRVRRDLLSIGQFGGPTQQSSFSGASQSPIRSSRQTPNRINSASAVNNQRRRNSSSAGPNANGGADLAASQTADETPTLEPAPVTSPSTPVGSNLFERFAYVLPNAAASQLSVIDLTDSNRVIFSRQHSEGIAWIAFSHTSRYLAYRCSNNRLNLVEFSTCEQAELLDESNSDQMMHQVTAKPETQARTSVLLESCDGLVEWLPGTDSLVAQSGPLIYTWYDLTEGVADGTLRRQPKPAGETFDTRTYNYINRRPLVDLSSLSRDNEQPARKSHPALLRVSDSHGQMSLVLSNGRTIEMDGVKTSFYAKLAVDALDEAFGLLENWNPDGFDNESQPPGADESGQQDTKTASVRAARLRPLYMKLGWLALDREGKCELARRIFARLDYGKLVKFLELCLGEPDGRRREVQLAKLRADWPKFERLARDQDEIVATYRRLNKWSQLIDYLTRRQQFRQRDMAEQDHLEWLTKSGRRLEAAQLLIRLTGNLQGALELLLGSGELEAAADLLLKKQRLPLRAGELVAGSEPTASSKPSVSTAAERKLRELVEFEIRDKLIEAGREGSRLWLKAAEINERILGETDKALELYLSGRNFALALDLLKRQQTIISTNGGGGSDEAAAKIKEEELRCADLMRDQFQRDPLMGVSRKRATKCIDLYLSAGYPLKALCMANLLRMPERGFSVLELLKQRGVAFSGGDERDEFLDGCNELGWQLVALGQEGAKRKALDAFESGESIHQLAELLLELKEFDRAFRVALERINNHDRELTENQFVAFADELWSSQRRDAGQQRHQEAELIYALANRAELAIEMYERLGEHEKMLELVERHQVDQLEGKLLQLAKTLELSGQLEEAEKYLLRASASEWTNVVRMYRLANRWPDAYRVARANCISERDPLLVQLAYWWAKSVQSTPDDASVWHKRRSLLNKLGLLKQVVEFCCETKNFPFALELVNAESNSSSSSQRARTSDDDEQGASVRNLEEARREVILRYATFLEQQHKLDQAERLLLENNLIELAVRMYTDNEDYKSAIRVIETQLAQVAARGLEGEPAELVDGRRQALSELLNATLVECARRLVADVTPASCRGANLVMGRPPSRTSTSTSNSSAGSPADRLQAAQQMFLRAQRPELAVEMYQSLGLWREAIQVAQRFAPRLLEAVERALDELVSDDLGPILEAGDRSPGGVGAAVETPIGELDGRPAGGEVEERAELDDQRVAGSEIHAGSKGVAPETRTWREFESNLSQGKQAAAGQSLATYLGHLIDQPAHSVSSKQLRPLERFLVEARKQRSIQASAIVSEREIAPKLLKLADTTFGSELGWSGWLERPADEVRAIWLSWRNILAGFAKLFTGSMLPGDAPHIERRLLVAHFVVLHCGLVSSLQSPSTDSTGGGGGGGGGGDGGASSAVSSPDFVAFPTIRQVVAAARDARNQAVTDLLSKISFSMLRYSDLIDPRQVLWLAGLWQLAASHHQMVRSIWALLIELVDRVASGEDRGSETAPAELMRAKLGQLVDVPERIRLEPNRLSSSSLGVQRINQVRQWLLESLIEGDQTRAGRPEVELPARGWAVLSGLCCLASGLPAAPSGGGRTNGIRGGAGAIIVGARERRAAARCDEMLELIGLCGIRVADRLGADQLEPKRPANMQELEQQLGSELEARRRVVASSGFRPSQRRRSRQLTGSDQLVEIIDFLLGL